MASEASGAKSPDALKAANPDTEEVAGQALAAVGALTKKSAASGIE